MIDNSASMGDKQAYLATAIPDLVTQLVATTQDIHIGIVSSSLGPRLGDQTSSGSSGARSLPTATTARQLTPSCSAQGNQTQNPRRRTPARLLQRPAATYRRQQPTRASPPTTPRGPLRPHGPARWRRPHLLDVHADTWPGSRLAPEHACNSGVPCRDPSRDVSTQLVSAISQDLIFGVHDLRLRYRVAARELVPLPRPAGPVRLAHARRAMPTPRGPASTRRFSSSATTSSAPTRSSPSST